MSCDCDFMLSFYSNLFMLTSVECDDLVNSDN